MTYKETIEHLYASLPMFQRIGGAALTKDLTNIRRLCDMLSQPQDAFRSIHIAGTNGKGSTSHILAAVFQAAGWKTGLYTSPHYADFRERIKVDGAMISEEEVVAFVVKYKANWVEFKPSFFEITVAMAFDHFRNHQVDIAIIETGMGGRLDSTNIILPDLSVITNIGHDHNQFLGDTLAEIAGEKAGIMKPGKPAIIGVWQNETQAVFVASARKVNSKLHFACRHMRVARVKGDFTSQHLTVWTRSGTWFDNLKTDLVGPFQLFNIRTALEAIWRWNEYYSDDYISDQSIRKGLSNVKTSTGLVGRWMVLSMKPIVITDAAHNEHGMKAMLPALLEIPARRRHFVLGFVSDKDLKKVLAFFPIDGIYYWCTPDIPRGRPAAETAELAKSLGFYGTICTSVRDAYAQAHAEAGPKDLVFVGGSSYVVGDLLQSLQMK